MTKKKPPVQETADDGLDARTLPHNLEAERSVLGAIMVHNEAFNAAAQVITADDFYRDAHRRIFAAMVTLIDEKHVAADFVMLKEELGRHGDLDEVGGPAYISSLATGVPRSTNVAHYAAIVKEKSLLRALVYAANAMLTDAYAGEEEPAALVAKADAALLKVQLATRSSRLADLRGTMSRIVAELDYRASHRGELIGLDTGFPSLNDLTFGWLPGDEVIIAARPSIGKTSFVLNSALAAAQRGKRVAIFSLEMRRRQLEYRLLSSLSGVAITRLTSGYLGSVDHERIALAFETMHELPIFIDDRSGQTALDIRTGARRVKADGGLDLVVVDYIQLVPGTLDGRTTRNEQVTDISRRFKDAADELNVPFLVLSQLSRANDKRADPRPRLSDLRESGALEQDSDIVAFLHRESHRTGGPTELILEKQRNGPTGTVMLSLDRDTTTFTDAGPKPEPAAPPGPTEVQEGLPGVPQRPRRRRYF